MSENNMMASFGLDFTSILTGLEDVNKKLDALAKKVDKKKISPTFDEKKAAESAKQMMDGVVK